MTIAERVAMDGVDKQSAAAAAASGASSSAASVNCSELQPHAAVASDSVRASATEEPPSAQLLSSNPRHWTSIDFSTEDEDNKNFVREFPGKHIPKIKKEHIKLLREIPGGSQGSIHIAQVHRYNLASDKYEPKDEYSVAKVYKRITCGQWPEEVFGLHLQDMHICQFYGYCLEEDCFILLMKKYDCSLRQVLDKPMRKVRRFFGGKTLPDFNVFIVLIRIALGMRFLHERDIVHRDLKADNIFVLLNRGGTPSHVYIGDFDVASNVMGTAFFRAPEVLQALKDGRRPVFTPQTDVYSYAMTCYEILTGNYPLNEVKISNYDVVLSGKRPELPSNLHPKMKDLLNRCWHQDPSMRPTFHKIVEELEGLYRELLIGCKIASRHIDEIFHDAKSPPGMVGVDPESCMAELQELLRAVMIKHKQADFLLLGCELIAEMEQYQSEFGFPSFSMQEQPPPPVPYPEWFRRVVLSYSINWKSEVFFGILPYTSEVARMRRLMMRIRGSRMGIPDCSDSTSCSVEEMAARAVELETLLGERRKRILPDNPHRACLEQLDTGHGNYGFQACDLCTEAYDACTVPGESVTSFLYVDDGSLLKKLLPSSLLSFFQAMLRFLF